MERVRISKNFYLDEFTRSNTAARFGIDNSVVVGSQEYLSLYELTRHVLQPIRDAKGVVTSSSGYRCSLLNLKIGGEGKSQHIKGEADDFTVQNTAPLQICEWIVENLQGEFDQLIYEFGEWVHVSRSLNGNQRGEVLTSVRVDGETRYLQGLVSKS